MSGCPHGCEDGFIVVGDAARPCSCLRERHRGEFASSSYSPGGRSETARRRELARRNGRAGGLVSGVKRRQLARGSRIPRARSQASALALRFAHHQLTRRQFNARYAHTFSEPEWPAAAVQWERGRDTAWLAYTALFRCYRSQGQHFRTTKPQRAAGLARDGRARCPRTVQRVHRRLEAMGLLVASHYKLGGWREGRRDHLVVEIRTPRRIACLTAPSGQPEPCPSEQVPAAAPGNELRSAPSTASIPPPSAADGQPPDKPAEQPATEREELERRLAFEQLKLDAGWGGRLLELEVVSLRRQLSLLDEPGQDLERIASTTSEGFRCST